MKKLIEKYNDLLSAKYDKATQGEFRWAAPAVMERHIKPYIKRGGEVLDIGVGTGQSARIFIEHGVNITGVDISERMLEIAQSKFKFKKLIRSNVEKGLLNFFPIEKFDIIIAIGILEFIEDIKKTLIEVRQLLKRGGVIVFTYELFKPNNNYGIKKISPLGAGLEKTPNLLGFKVYRRLPVEIDNILKEISLTIVSREKFIGYLRSQLKIPVSYELLIVR